MKSWRIGRLVAAFAAALLTAATLVGTARAEEAKGGPPPSVRIRPLMLPVLSSSGQVERYTQLEVTLEVKDAGKLADVQVAIPKLHDAILAEMYRAIDDGFVIRGAVANAPAVRRNLLDASNRVVGKDVIGRVLITPTTRQSAWP